MAQNTHVIYVLLELFRFRTSGTVCKIRVRAGMSLSIAQKVLLMKFIEVAMSQSIHCAVFGIGSKSAAQFYPVSCSSQGDDFLLTVDLIMNQIGHFLLQFYSSHFSNK